MNAKWRNFFLAVALLLILALLAIKLAWPEASPAAGPSASSNLAAAAGPKTTAINVAVKSPGTVVLPVVAPASVAGGSLGAPAPLTNGDSAAALPETVISNADKIKAAQIFVTQAIETPLLQYKLITGHYPMGDDGLNALIENTEGVPAWRGPYIKADAVPLDPWGHPYEYAFPSSHGQGVGKYDVWSDGPDGTSGTADDIGNWMPSP